jgi:Tol biopolymer transport system component
MRGLAVAVGLGVGLPAVANAGCNLIPVAALELPAAYIGPTQNGVVGTAATDPVGYLDRAEAGPGQTVTVRADLACQPAEPGFALPSDPNPNQVTLVFHAPDGSVTSVDVPTASLTPIRCDTARCEALQFIVPDTSAFVPGGLTGPAEIKIQRLIGGIETVVAHAYQLYQPARSCQSGDWGPDTVFGRFTVLPAPNTLNGDTVFVGATDGYGNLLLPLDFHDLLKAETGAPVATILQVVPNAAFQSALSGASSDVLRSFNLLGRPIPPIFRLAMQPAPVFVGSTDVLASVAQIQPVGNLNYASLMLADGAGRHVGPVQLGDSIATVRTAIPLTTLRSSSETLAGGGDEALVGDLNGDSDTKDLVVEVTDVATGALTNTGFALSSGPLGLEATEPEQQGQRPALVVNGGFAAFLESEKGDGVDRNGNGSLADSVLRVFAANGTQVNYGIPAAADTAGLLPGTPPVALSGGALSDGYAFFLRSEAGEASVAPVLASVDSSNNQGNGPSIQPSLSAQGRYVAFVSFASNLVPGDTNGVPDVFVRDRQMGTTERVSVDTPGNQANGTCIQPTITADGMNIHMPDSGNQANNGSIEPSISADGRYVAFVSFASNLVPGDTNGVPDVFVRDRQMATTKRVSVDSSGNQANGASLLPSISADGRYVAFVSFASNLVPGDTNGVADVFVRDLQMGTTQRVSVDSSGNQVNGPSFQASISGDGSNVAFVSFASNLVQGDTNGVTDVFERNQQTGTTQRVSVDSSGNQANGASLQPSSNTDGSKVAFVSFASNLVPNDTSGVPEVFVHNPQTGTTERVSLDSFGNQANGGSFQPSISADGSTVAFFSLASNLVSGDTNSLGDVFVHALQIGTTRRISVGASGKQGNSASDSPSISADGNTIAFESLASNLVPGDTNGVSDIFVSVPACPPRPPLPANWCDFDANGSLNDNVLFAVNTSTGDLISSAKAASQTVVDGGQGLFVDQTRFAYLFDPSTGTVSPLTVAGGSGSVPVAVPAPGFLKDGRAVALSRNVTTGQLGAVCALWDTSQGTGFGTVVAGSGPSVQSTGVVSDLIAAVTSPAGSFCVARDVSGANLGLQVVNVNTLQVTNVGWTAADFIVGEGSDVVAFRTRESLEASNPLCKPPLRTPLAGGCDLNGDGDVDDLVMQAYDLATGTVLDLARQAIPCTFPACDAFKLYAVDGSGPSAGRVSFLGTEPGQAVGFGCLVTSPPGPPGQCDLDGNGRGTDTVVHVMTIAPDVSGLVNVRSQQVISVSTNSTLGFFPTQVVGQTVLTTQLTECDLARSSCCVTNPGDPICSVAQFAATFPYAQGSCAAQFDLDPAGAPGNPNDLPGALDCVTLRSAIVGDSDRDGVLDVATNGVNDVCQELPDPLQGDFDNDGLGDTPGQSCDPNPHSPKPAAGSCDLDGNGQVDQRDVNLIFNAVGSYAQGFPAFGWDARDRDSDGLITVRDAALCKAQCTYPNCAITPTPLRQGCGLLGIEALLVLVALRRRVASQRGAGSLAGPAGR